MQRLDIELPEFIEDLIDLLRPEQAMAPSVSFAMVPQLAFDPAAVKPQVETLKLAGAFAEPLPETSRSLKSGTYVDFGEVRKWKRFSKVRFYAHPPGALRLVSRRVPWNFTWYIASPANHRTYYKRRRRNVRVGAIAPLLGPKADWKTLTGTIKKVAANLPDIIEQAGLIGGAVASGGATASTIDPGQILDTAGRLLEDAGSIADTIKARLRAADAVIGAMYAAKVNAILRVNPHLRRRAGGLDLSPSYKANPRFKAELGMRGDAYPTILIP